MIYKVVYFTRTGSSKRIAEKIAKKLSCEVIQITDNKNWKGFIGFIKGGFYSSANKSVQIQLSTQIEDYDELVVVSPLWAGGVVPAIKEFLKSVVNDKVHLVMNSNGSTIKDHPSCKSISNIMKNEENEDVVVDVLVKQLLETNA